MKNLFKLTVLLLFIGLMQPISAQESVKESISFAKKLTKKVKKRRFNKFNNYYSTALSDIATIEAGANTEFGYDKIADNIHNWIKLNNLLAKFDGGTITYKDNTIELKVKDYAPLKEEAFTKAAQAHFDAGVNIINTKETYKDKKASFKHFTKCEHYDLSKTHIDKMNEIKAKVHYDEGFRLYEEGANYEEKEKSVSYFRKANKISPNFNNSNDLVVELYYNEGVRVSTLKTFKEREKCISYFESANNISPNYKENKEVIAKVFFDEAQKFSDSEEIKDLKYSKNLIQATKKYSPEYSGCDELYTTVCEKGASVLYEEANSKAEEENFKAQAEASKLYKNILDNWSKDYKDVAEKEISTRNNSKINVLIVASDGSIADTKTFYNSTSILLKNYIRVNGNYALLEGLDMNNTDNYESAKEKLGYGFVVIKLSDETSDAEVNSFGPTTTTRTITKYYKKSPKNDNRGKFEIIELSKSDFDKDLKLLKLIDPNGSKTHISFYTKEGTLTTISEKSIASKMYVVEILDARDPSSADQLSTRNVQLTAKDEVIKQSYNGPKETKPRVLRNDTRELKSDEYLIKQLGTVSIKKILKNNTDNYIMLLNKIEYRSL